MGVTATFDLAALAKIVSPVSIACPAIIGLATSLNDDAVLLSAEPTVVTAPAPAPRARAAVIAAMARCCMACSGRMQKGSASLT